MSRYDVSLWAAIPAVLALGAQMVTAGAGDVLKLDPELAKRLGKAQLPMSTGAGDSVGVVQAALPDALGDLAQGTVMMQLRFSRRVCHTDGKPRKMDLLASLCIGTLPACPHAQRLYAATI